MALQGFEPWRIRDRSLVQTHVALAHLRSRDLEQAAAYGRDALRTATDVNSTMIAQRLSTLHRHRGEDPACPGPSSWLWWR